jgi:sodium pump decarboxylase gamma subunit
MIPNDVLGQGLVLMGAGMGIVFLTLVLLVVIIVVLRDLLRNPQKIEPDASEVLPAGVRAYPETSGEESIAAVAAAIHHFQKG